MWYSWTSVASFDAWHNTVKAGLGFPKPGTTAYTATVQVTPTDLRAWVDDDVAASFAAGLGVQSTTPYPPPPDPSPDQRLAAAQAALAPLEQIAAPYTTADIVDVLLDVKTALGG